MAEFSEEITVRNSDELISAFRAIKDRLGLSNALCDELGGLVAGHTDKVLGPTRVKKLSPFLIDVFCGLFAVELVIRPNLEAAKKMAGRWEQRNASQVRPPARISRELLARAKPLVLSEMAKKGWRTRRALRS